MTRGRKPTPPALRQLTGNPGHRPQSGAAPHVEPGVPEAPEHLAGEALAEWERLAPVLSGERMVTALDRGVLAAYCSAWAEFVEADQMVHELGSVLVSPRTGQPYMSPYVNLRAAASRRLLQCAAELGFTPTSRGRVHVAGGDERADPLTELLHKYAARN